MRQTRVTRLPSYGGYPVPCLLHVGVSESRVKHSHPDFKQTIVDFIQDRRGEAPKSPILSFIAFSVQIIYS